MTLLILRALSLIAWGSVSVALLPSVYRSMGRAGSVLDAYRAAFAFVGLIFVGFNLRWFIAADDEAMRLALQALGLVLAVYILRLCGVLRRKGS